MTDQPHPIPSRDTPTAELGVWRPTRRQGKSFVLFVPTSKLHVASDKRLALGRDGTPLSFWNEASAQMHADSLNRKGVLP